MSCDVIYIIKIGVCNDVVSFEDKHFTYYNNTSY